MPYYRRRNYAARYRRPYYRRSYNTGRSARTSRSTTVKRRRTTKRTYAAKKMPVTKMSRFTLAQIDPFNPDVRGVKVPDESTAPSSSFLMKQEVGMYNDGAGAAWCRGAFLYPNALVQQINGLGTAGTTVDWGAAYATNRVTWLKATSLAAAYEVVRPVAHGIRITCPLAPTSVTGNLHVALYSLSTYGHTTWQLPTSIAAMRELPHYKRYTLASLTQTPVTVVNKYLDNTAFRYTDSNSPEYYNTQAQQFNVPGEWMGILVMVEGHPVTTQGAIICDLEVICHFEGQAKFDSLNSDTLAYNHDQNVMDATAAAQSRSDAVFQGPSEAAQRLQQMGGAIAQQVADNLQPHVEQGIANIITNAAVGAAAAGTAVLAPGLPGINNANRG